MSTTSLTAKQVMDRVAPLMNDSAKDVYTYTAQLPYLGMALDELMEEFQLNGIPVTQKTSALINVAVGVTEIAPAEGTAPNYPSNLVEIVQIWERLQGSSEQFIPVKKRDFLPHYVQKVDSLIVWAWNEQKIKFLGATTAREVKLDYIFALFPDIDTMNENTVIGIINARSYLQYRTAGLCAEYIGENETRAASLNAAAVAAIYRSMGISIKAKQQVVHRRRPFRAAYKASTQGTF